MSEATVAEVLLYSYCSFSSCCDSSSFSSSCNSSSCCLFRLLLLILFSNDILTHSKVHIMDPSTENTDITNVSIIFKNA